MKDLDFDEIDRAVNSLVTKKPNNISQPVPAPSSDSDLNNQVPAVIPPVLPPLSMRRTSGRFMDVVHPSSNMRPSILTEARPAKVETPVPQIKPKPPVSELPTTDSSFEKSDSKDWPDPIDFHESKQQVPQKNVDTEDDDIDKISNEITKSLSKMPEESLESPFLSGAKVEKRPLGAFSNESPALNTENISKSELENEVNKKQELSDEEISTPLPAELQNDVLKIEADSSTHPEKDDSVIPSANTQPVATSINQQYTEKPSTGDQSTGAIYDTSSYHKNIVRPTKKKSGWMWVLWIFVLLVVGTGAGVAVYFFVLAR